MGQPRLLTFNFHEPYLCLMAKTGLEFDVGRYESGTLERSWQTTFRPLPDNLSLLPEAEWRGRLDAGEYDVLIAHNEMNALDLVDAPARRLLVCHNRRSYLNTTATVDQGDPVDAFDRLLSRLEGRFEFIFISNSKRADYGIPGRVIPPGIDLDEFSGYRGDEACVLRVGNMMRQRDLMFDVELQEAVCAGLPTRVVGECPGIDGAAPAPSYAALLEHYRGARCMLHVSRQEYEDGYNLATLEAMACGMPVVALANRTSPITDGKDGFVSHDATRLRAAIEALLEDHDLAREIGEAGRRTVAEKFSIDAFAENWRAAIFEAAEGKTQMRWRMQPKRPGHIHLLLHYIASPLTTGRYFEFAAQRCCNVTTAGLHLPTEVLDLWGFPEKPPPYPPHRVDLPHKASYESLLDALPQGYRSDLYFYVDSGSREIEPDIDLLPMPKIAYLIDTHVAPELRLAMARHFDCVFLAQKAQTEAFGEAGLEEVHWIPLACWPELHAVPEQARRYDVSYVGSFSAEEGERRKDLLDQVAQRFPNHCIGRYWPQAMARVYAESKIVVNACHNRDVNMRVFEAMASGALLVTDEADGLEDLFTDGEHLVIYRNDAEVLDRIAYYLEHEEERERIARSGQRLVLAEHTYTHRMDAILAKTQAVLGPLPKRTRQDRKYTDYYEHPRREVIQHVPLRAQRVLDVGCGAGALGATLKRERNVAEVVGVELAPEAAAKAEDVLDHVLVGSIEDIALPYAEGYFDCIVCADVIEHLAEPVDALRRLGHLLSEDGVIVASVPNVRFHEMVRMLASGMWSYESAGLMDSTHLRWFTRGSLKAAVAEAGLEAAEINPLSIMDRDMPPRSPQGDVQFGNLTIHGVSEEEYEEFAVYQFVVIASKPGRDRLEAARQALEANENETALALAADAVGVDPFEQRHIAAKAFARLGELDKAESYYRELVKMRRGPAVLGELGTLLVAREKHQEARQLLEEALAGDPGNDRAKGALSLVLLCERDFARAFSAMKDALDASFDNVPLLAHFKGLAQSLGRSEEAEPLYARFADFYPGNSNLACDHAELLTGLGRDDEALERVEGVLLFEPGHERACGLRDKLGGQAP